ncbi:MAG: hypothetical protein WC292_00805 [Clostridia bacterium]
MGTIEIVVIALAALLVAFTLLYNIIRKIKGKSSCGCQEKTKDDQKQSCSSCSGCMFASDCKGEKDKSK